MPSDPDLVPFEPPPQPMTGLAGLRAMRRNFIEMCPRAAYEEPVTRIKTALTDTLLLCDPELIHDMLVERAHAFSRDEAARRALGPVIGESSLLLAEGAEWRWQRRAASPIFRRETLVSFVPVFAEMAAQQVARWREVGDEPVDVSAAMTRTTMDVIVATMLGGAANLDVARYSRALAETLEAAQWLALFAMLSLPRWVPYPGVFRAVRARRHVHREMDRILAARRARPSSRPDLLDLLVAARDADTGRHMSARELANNVLTFINAGHETTAAGLTWTLWLIARDPAVQDRLCDEVGAVAGTGTIEPAHVDRLVLCGQVIQESMRLYPPVPAFARQPHAATTLGNERITPATNVVVPIYVLHRHRRLWDEPETFAPGRFASDQAKARRRHTYLPFGVGPRVCIGASFAMLEATVVLAALVRAFRFHTVPNHRPRPISRVSLRPQDGMPLHVAPR